MVRWVVLSIILISLTAIVATVGAGVSLFRSLHRTIEYDVRSTSVPVDGLCAGQSFSITVHIHVSNAPTIVSITESWFGVDAGYNVVLGERVFYSVITSPEEFTRDLTVVVPPLPPGRYEYRRGAQDDEAPVAAFGVPVVVKQC